MDPLLSITLAFVAGICIPLVIAFVNVIYYITFITIPLLTYVLYLWIVDKLVPSRLKSPPLSSYGLSKVYPPAGDGPASTSDDNDKGRIIDVIFVHGLGSNPDTTWCAGAPTGDDPGTAIKLCCWITDFLPDDLTSEGLEKHVRLLTFNYDSFWMNGANSTRLEEIGQTLINDIPKEKENPIVFVGHSYGGLVIKKALVLCPSEHKQALAKRIKGILFLGTPHRGTAFTRYGLIVGEAFSPLDSNTAILYPLLYDSETLRDLQTRFISEYKDTECVYFYEKHKMRRYLFGFIPFIQEYIVNEASATDNAIGVNKVPLETNHSGLNKFNRRDNNYSRVCQRLIKAVKRSLPPPTREVAQTRDSTPEPVAQARDLTPEPVARTKNLTPDLDEQDCLKSLAFPEMRLRQNDVDPAADKTCRWLLSHKTYQTWLNCEGGLLWIQGKPGSGKSTLLKYILQNIEDQSSPSELVVASFFFNARGSNIQKTRLGLLRSLLHQISSRIRTLRESVTAVFVQKRMTHGDPGKDWHWHERELQDIFEAFLRHAPKTTYRIRVYIDALDECGEDTAVTLAGCFKRWIFKPSSSKASLSICFSCRHYPIIEVETPLLVCIEDENHIDIETYVHEALKIGFSEPHKAEVLEKNIVMYAKGVFLWVVLVVPRVLRLSRNGITSLQALLEEIRKIPTELNRLYEEVLTTISDEDLPQSLQLIQWICFALEPLSLRELRYALAVDANISSPSLRECRQAKDYVETNDDLERRVKDLSRGLAEVKRTSLWGKYTGSAKYTSWGESRVQFIHESVSDYLLQSGLRTLDKSTSDSVTGHAHLRLSRSCIRYISMEEIAGYGYEEDDRSVVHSSPRTKRNSDKTFQEHEEEFPFLQYATKYWFKHVEKAESEHVSDEVLLQQLCSQSSDFMRLWITIYRNIHHFYGHRPERGATLLHISSGFNLPNVLKSVLKLNNIDANMKDHAGGTPLSIAAYEGHVAAVKMLLARDDVDVNLKGQKAQTPLSLAVDEGHEMVARLLLARDNINVNLEGGGGYERQLFGAVRRGDEAITKLLLNQDGVEVNAKDERGLTPLHTAVIRGFKSVIKLLLERDQVDVNLGDHCKVTPLFSAAASGDEERVKLLLTRDDIDVNLTSFGNQTPLSGAAYKKNEPVVKLLLDRDDAEVNLMTLYWAAKGGCGAVIKLLLNRNDLKIDLHGSYGPMPPDWDSWVVDEAVEGLLLAWEDLIVRRDRRFFVEMLGSFQVRIKVGRRCWIGK